MKWVQEIMISIPSLIGDVVLPVANRFTCSLNAPFGADSPLLKPVCLGR